MYIRIHTEMSSNVNVNLLHHCVLTESLVVANPELNVVSGGLRQLLAEPRRVVVLAAAMLLAPFSSAVPQRVAGVDVKLPRSHGENGGIAEVIVSDVGGELRRTHVAGTLNVASSLVRGCGERPDVLS